MNSMEVHLGVIRDRLGIYSGLLESRDTNRQLAVCFASDGKLLVKVSVVKKLIQEGDSTTVVLASAEDPPNETAVPFDKIQSIYPIRDFLK